jgi:hypothetical protein
MNKLANYFLKSTCSIICENYKLPTWKSFAVYYTCFRISFNEMRLHFYFFFLGGSKFPSKKAMEEQRTMTSIIIFKMHPNS